MEGNAVARKEFPADCKLTSISFGENATEVQSLDIVSVRASFDSSFRYDKIEVSVCEMVSSIS